MSSTCFYVSCAGSREILVLALDPQRGHLDLRQRLPLPGAVLPLKLSADGHVLLAGTRGEDALHALAVDPLSGALTPLGSAASPGGPTYIGLDPSRRLAFVASYGNNLLAAFPLSAKGAPSAAVTVLRDLPRAHAALVDASGRWLLVPTLAADAIRVYALDADADPCLSPPTIVAGRAGRGPRHLVLSTDNRRAYCLNELDGSIDAFAFDAAHGQLTLTQSVSMLPHGFHDHAWAAEIRGSPDGRFLYASDRRSSTVATLGIDPEDGKLVLLGHIETEAQPRGMALSSCGRWLAVAGQLSNHLALYALDPATGLPQAHAREPVGEEPICVEAAGA